MYKKMEPSLRMAANEGKRKLLFNQHEQSIHAIDEAQKGVVIDIGHANSTTL